MFEVQPGTVQCPFCSFVLPLPQAADPAVPVPAAEGSQEPAALYEIDLCRR